MTATTQDPRPAFFTLTAVLVIVAMPVVTQTLLQVAFTIGLAACVVLVLRVGRDARTVSIALALGIEACLFLGSAIR